VWRFLLMRPVSVSSMVSIPLEEQNSISSWRTVSVADDEDEHISLIGGKFFLYTDYLFSLWYICLVPVGLALLVLPFEAVITLLYLLGSWCCSWCCCANRATTDVSPSPKRVNASPRTLDFFDEYVP
jgi:hypothetical protein